MLPLLPLTMALLGAPPPGLACLRRAYPEHLCGATETELVWCDGTRMAWDDRGARPAAVRLAAPTLADQMAQPYPRRGSTAPPAREEDPGRVRVEAFFRKMYGGRPAEVGARLATVRWMPRTGGPRLRVTTVNGVHEQLRAVSAALDRLPAAIRRLVVRPSGTYRWRRIHGTRRLSPHAFGIAIDVAVSRSDYWRWRGEGRYRTRIPWEVVRIFEDHGFIWGGRWWRYDTMHFEYRPELLGCGPG